MTAAVAFVLPADVLGRRLPSDLYGGYLGHYAVLAILWTVLLDP